jgi:hypothetical protein
MASKAWTCQLLCCKAPLQAVTGVDVDFSELNLKEVPADSICMDMGSNPFDEDEA